MLDELRRDIERRLGDLLGEADKLRRALTALRSNGARSSSSSAGSSTTRSRRATTAATTRRPARASERRVRVGGRCQAFRHGPGHHVTGGVRRYQDRDPGGAGERHRDDGRRGGQRDRARMSEHQHDAVQAGQVRRGDQGRPRVPAHPTQRDQPARVDVGACATAANRLQVHAFRPTARRNAHFRVQCSSLRRCSGVPWKWLEPPGSRSGVISQNPDRGEVHCIR